MKSVTIIISFLAFIVMSLGTAQSTYAGDNEKSNIVLKGKKETPSLRPGAPSKQLITVSYDGETLFINYAVSEGECTCYVTDVTTGNMTIHYFDSADLYAEIDIPGLQVFDIEIVTQKGNVYTGTLSLLE